MEINLITKEDLVAFKKEILKEIKELLEGKKELEPDKAWLKSQDVRKMLNISPGTLQNLRIHGTLLFTKIGGSIYYRREDVDRMMNGGKNEK
jgi:hypothetical protein